MRRISRKVEKTGTTEYVGDYGRGFVLRHLARPKHAVGRASPKRAEPFLTRARAGSTLIGCAAQQRRASVRRRKPAARDGHLK
ncbi:hypothetical protein DRB87_12685 [Pandoraea sp. XY-2]|nr:hypothetical protein DRB87_12685 [Pandoraea sp. XY-2]